MTQTQNWKRTFFTIWVGQAVSLITSAIVQMAFIFYLTQMTNSALILSLASLAGFLPYALLGPLIGVWVDRYDRKRIMIGADLMIALCSAGFAGIAYYMDPPGTECGDAAVGSRGSADPLRWLQPGAAIRQLYHKPRHSGAAVRYLEPDRFNVA